MKLANIRLHKLIPSNRHATRPITSPQRTPLFPFLAHSEGLIKSGHPINQDSAGYFVGNIHGIEVSATLVCDGVGGDFHSEEASEKSIEFFAEALFALDCLGISTFNSQTMLSLIEQTQERLISEKIKGSTTFTCAILLPDKALFAKVADSKIVMGNTNGESRHLGYDHNGYWGTKETSGLQMNVLRTTQEASDDMEEFLAEYSKMAPEPAAAKRMKSLYSTLGAKIASPIYVTISMIPLLQDKKNHGRFVLFSDGVTTPLDLLGRMLVRKQNTLEVIAEELVVDNLGDDRTFVLGDAPKAFDFANAVTEGLVTRDFFTR